MAKIERKWNLTLKRFESIVSKELSDDLEKEFTAVMGHSSGAIEHKLYELFDQRTWLSKEDKILTVQMMIKIFVIFREEGSSINVYQLFAKALFIRHPGAFEIFEASPERIKSNAFLYKYKSSRYPQAAYTYLKLLQLTGFQTKYISDSDDVTATYLQRARDSKNLTSMSLDFDNVSDWLGTTLISKNGLDGFGSMSLPVIILMRAIYGSEKLEPVLRAFVDSDFHIYPDDLLKVLDKWEEFNMYPGQWIVEVLGLENAKID